MTPASVYARQVRAVCGEDAVRPMLEVFRDIEAVTSRLEDHAMGLTFPTAGMMMGQWFAEPMPQKLADDQAIYQRARRKRGGYRCRTGRREGLTCGTGRHAWSLPSATSMRSRRSRGRPAPSKPLELPKKGVTRHASGKTGRSRARGPAAHSSAYRAIDTFAGVARNRADAARRRDHGRDVCRQLDRKTEQLRGELEKMK